MVAEITTAISRLPWLFVIARNSQFHACESLLDPRFAGATRVDAT
jgi:TolB-like protein